MQHDSTVYVGLDVHKESIMVAYSIDMGEVELLGTIGTTRADIDRMCKRLQSKASCVQLVYEAGPCGYGLYRQLTDNWLLVSALILYRAVEQPEAQNNVGHGMLKMRQYVSVCEDEGIKRSSTIATLSRAPTMLRKALT